MTAAALTNNLPLLATPFDSGGVNSVVPTPTQMSNGFLPNVDIVEAEQQNYLHQASTTLLWLIQQLGLSMPFNPVAGASIVATPKGGIVSLRDSVTGDTQFYLALADMAIGYTDPSLDPTNWTYINFEAITKYRTPYADAAGTVDARTGIYTSIIYPVLQDGLRLVLDIPSPNLTTTPTFQPTLNGALQTARTIVKYVDGVLVALAAGDLQGVCELSYHVATTVWILVNPAFYIATSAQAIAGTSNRVALTPLQLRNGLNASGAAPIYANRAWINFDGTGAVSVRGSGNIASITDHGVGAYTANFTTALPDVNYAVTGIARVSVATSTVTVSMHPDNVMTTSSFKFSVNESTVGPVDSSHVLLNFTR